MAGLESLDLPGLLGFLVEVTLKGTIILAAAGLAAAVFRSASAAMRHLIWSTALVLLLALPGFIAYAPTYDVAVLPANLMPSITETPAPERVSREVRVRDRSRTPVHRQALDDEQSFGSAATRSMDHSTSITQELPATTTPAVVRKAAAPLDWRKALFALWIIGATLVAARYAMGWIALRRIRRRSVPVADVGFRLFVKRVAADIGLRRRIRLVWGSPGSMPLMFGCVRPTVLLPEDAGAWETDRLLVVLKHELAHVKRWDCLVQAIVYFACTIYWFNPLVWVAAAQSHREREMACDDYVLSTGSQGGDYAEHLLDIARSLQGPRFSGVTTIAMARRSELEGRLLAILSPNRRRGKATARGVLATFAVLSCLVMTVAALRPVALPAAEQEEQSRPDTRVAAAIAAPEPGKTATAAEVRSSASLNARASDYDEQYVAEASAIVERAAATLETSLSRLVPRTIRLNGSLIGQIDGAVDLIAEGGPEIVSADTIPLEQIRRLRNAGVDVEFIEEMAAAGFDRLTVDQLVSLAHAGVDAEYVRRLGNLGFKDLSPDDLVDLGFADVDASDIEMWAELGYQNLSARDLIKLSHAGIDGSDVRELAQAGYSNLSASELIRFGHADVDPEFIRELRESGLQEMSADDLVRLSHADIDAEFIRDMRAAGYADLATDDLIHLSHADVDPGFIRRMTEIGLTGLSPEELVRLGHADVDVEFVAEMRATGYDNLSVAELVSLSHADIDAQFVRDIGEMGLNDLGVEDLVKLGHADIDISFFRQMRESGYDGLSLDEVIQMGYAEVDPDYVARLAAAGVTGLSPMELVQLSHAGVDAEVIADLTKAGIENLSTGDLIQLGFADVDSDYIHELSSVGLTGLSVSDLVMLAHAEVDADDIRQLREVGVETNDPEKIVQFKYMDIDSDYVRRMRRALERDN